MTALHSIFLGSREFKVFSLDITDPENKEATGDIRYIYRLVSPKGVPYLLLRNVPNPKMLFAIHGEDFTKSTPFESKWFTDADRQGKPGPLRYLG